MLAIIFVISAFTLIHIYIFWRAGSVSLLRQHVSRKIIVGSGVVLWTLFLFYLSRLYGYGGTSKLAAMFEICALDWIVTLLLSFVLLLAIDVVTGFGFLLPRLASKLRGLGLAFVAVLSLVAIVQGMRPPEVQNYEVSLSGLPDELDGTVLVAVADMHIGSLIGKRWLEARVAQVRAEQPDLVVLLGDIIEWSGTPPYWDMIPVLRSLSAPLGVWAVLGDHESYGRQDTSVAVFDAAGFQTLRNSWAEVKPGLVLAGVDNLSTDNFNGQGDNPISRALMDCPPGATVFLSHKPWQADKVASGEAGLMLCGHTHGGQIWPLGYLFRNRFPFFDGRYEVDGMTLIVCRGAGTFGPRMRLWRPGEILRITLHREKF